MDNHKEAVKRYYDKNKVRIIDKKLTKYYEETLPDKIEKWENLLNEIENEPKKKLASYRYSVCSHLERELEKMEKIIEKIGYSTEELDELKKRFNGVIDSLLKRSSS